MLQGIVVPSSLELGSSSKTAMPDPEYKGTTILQNISNCPPNNTASHPRDLNLQVSNVLL
jgi:hypothetical protein